MYDKIHYNKKKIDLKKNKHSVAQFDDIILTQPPLYEQIHP